MASVYCEKIAAILVELKVISDHGISYEEDLVGSHLIDSVKFIELIVRIEEEFAIEFDLEDLLIENFSTIKVIAGKVEQLVA